MGATGPVGARRRRPLAVTVLTVLATAISVLAVLLVLAAWRNDHTISSDEGVATAEVLSAGRLRSAVSFVTPDGEMHNPRLGVLYPTNLVAGQRIDVESLAVIPALSVVVVTWAIAGPLILVLRRRARQV